ncbi:MAG: Ni/Fe hydrogenase subunit alpha [Hyphomicrobiaceae bacterium]|nr:Ni/Fe hydrogenase subunit alpha [Hyphomicrobiaceae bacterium]MCC0024960.1 Ni/Fe hydrogenase subunit alpha [Hyphomicrobiaceae bacterium]
MNERVLQVDALARVEGEGALYVKLKGDEIEQVEFRIFEPPRFFEAFMVGRDAKEAPDITSRICGICPIAYVMSASQAVEDAVGISVTPEISALRRLIYCGEWIQSHVLHAAMLHAPDFLELHDAIKIAEVNPDLVRKALRLKKAGNALMEAVGGRAVHPVNTRIGGFYSAPKARELGALLPELDWAAGAAREVAIAFSQFTFPDDEYDYHFVSLKHPDHYAIDGGRIVSNRGLDIAVSEFNDHFYEEHVARSNALHGRMRDGSPYLVGPLARYNNNFDQLTESAKETADMCGLGRSVKNPFQSIVVRMVEVQYAFEEAARIIRSYSPPSPSFIEASPRAGVGHGCTEAPRGICYHSYELDDQGLIKKAQIVPPTSQNQPQIEVDLTRVVAANMNMQDEDLKWRCEQTIRNYDPCISCATHFLKLTVERD